jgi:translation elongation factor EF-G
VKVDVTAVGYATFSSPYALDFCHTAIKAYTATMNATGDKLMMTLVEGPVPAQTGLFLQGTVGEAVSAAVPLATTVPDPVEGNVLVAHVDEGTVEAGNYVFSGTQDVRSLAFRRLSDPVTMPGGRAYLSHHYVLHLPSYGAQAKEAFGRAV